MPAFRTGVHDRPDRVAGASARAVPVVVTSAETLPGDWRRAVDPAALEARLRADKAGEIKAVLVVQVDTASAVVNDISAIRKTMDAAGHDALLMVDTIASLGTMPFEMDDWGVDTAVADARKGLMTPPGLSFVAAGGRAMVAHDLLRQAEPGIVVDGPPHDHRHHAAGLQRRPHVPEPDDRVLENCVPKREKRTSEHLKVLASICIWLRVYESAA